MSNKEALLTSNATNLERNIEQAISRIEDVPVDFEKIWNPDDCPAELLPWLAWSMSLDSWKSYWPEGVKRERIKQAVAIQRKKGTVKSVRDVVESFGSDVALREWHETNPVGDPHTFKVTMTMGEGVPNTAAYQLDIVNEIERTKPKRSHFELVAGLLANSGVGLQGIARPIVYRRLVMEEA